MAVEFGAQTMALPLKRVIMRSARKAMRGADPERWHYGPGFDANRAAAQHDRLSDLVAATGATIEWLDDDDCLADSVFTHDPSLVTDRGAVILRMGKALRAREPEIHARKYAELGIPVLGRVEAPGMVEGGDCVWLDERTLAVGRGVRTNQAGIQQLANLLGPLGVTVFGYDLPLWSGEDACLHLMSVVSPLSADTALAFLPLLPAPFYQELKARGVKLIAAPADEFHASNGLSLNVLATAPMRAIAVDGFPETRKAMEAAGCAVDAFEADALCIACEGGPTCLTRPILRA